MNIIFDIEETLDGDLILYHKESVRQIKNKL
jgi:hypothetical protein